MTRSDAFLDTLRAAVGAIHVLTDPDLRASYETDWTRRWRGEALAVVRPATTEELIAVVLASARTQIADYLSTLIYVYTLLIILYIVLQLLFSVGVRPPYSRTLDAVLGFLRDVCEPFLRIFRRVLPSFGGFDFSPILAIFTLQIINSIIVNDLIHG
jgi:YggT family protein